MQQQQPNKKQQKIENKGGESCDLGQTKIQLATPLRPLGMTPVLQTSQCRPDTTSTTTNNQLLVSCGAPTSDAKNVGAEMSSETKVNRQDQSLSTEAVSTKGIQSEPTATEGGDMVELSKSNKNNNNNKKLLDQLGSRFGISQTRQRCLIDELFTMDMRLSEEFRTNEADGTEEWMDEFLFNTLY
jgi:hypothetical protein